MTTGRYVDVIVQVEGPNLRQPFTYAVPDRLDEPNPLQSGDCVVDNRELHEMIKDTCAARHLLCNVADTPDLCDFYLGSIVQKGDLKIAISTNGKSPTLAKRIRAFLEDVIPDEIQDGLEGMEAVRKTLKGDFQEKIRVLNELTKGVIFRK